MNGIKFLSTVFEKNKLIDTLIIRRANDGVLTIEVSEGDFILAGMDDKEEYLVLMASLLVLNFNIEKDTLVELLAMGVPVGKRYPTLIGFSIDMNSLIIYKKLPVDELNEIMFDYELLDFIRSKCTWTEKLEFACSLSDVRGPMHVSPSR
jgi:hypothetical protein